MNRRSHALKGVSWVFLARTGAQGVRAISIVILARVLLPEDFGLANMGIVVMGLAESLRDAGLSNALIQRKSLSDEQSSGIFWVGLASGGSLAVLLALSAPWVASFYAEPDLTPLMRVLSASVLIGSLGHVSAAMLRRQLRFKEYSLIEFAVEVISTALAIAMAYSGFGVWSLIARALAGSFLRAGLCYAFAGWAPGFTFSFGAVKPLLAYGLPLIGFAILNYIQSRAGHVIVGRFVGVTELGFYAVGQSLMTLPTGLAHAVARVAFPVFSTYQEDRSRIGEHYVFMLKATVMIVTPAMIVLFAFTPELIDTFFSGRWADAGSVFRVFMILALIRSVQTPAATPFYALGRTGLHTGLALIFTPVTLLFYFIGSQWGAFGVAIALLIASAMLTVTRLAVVLPLLEMSRVEVVMRFYPVILAASLMSILLYGHSLLFPLERGITLDVVAASMGSAAAYAVALHIFDRDARTLVGILTPGVSRLWTRGKHGAE